MSGLDKLGWVKVNPGSVWLGSDDGRLQLSPVKQVPRHEVRIDYEFEITREAYSVQNLLSEAGISKEEFEEAGLRPPSEAEWELADEQNAISPLQDVSEGLADERPRMGYWGQRCDGHPRSTSYHAKLKLQRKWTGLGAEWGHEYQLNATERDALRVRLVRAPEPADNPPLIPQEDKRPILVREVLVALLIGIIPSFAWAWHYASTDYISNGWFNLVFGGLFIGVASGFVWRPRQPSYRVSEDGHTMVKSRR
jgi:hypothetical protein